MTLADYSFAVFTVFSGARMVAYLPQIVCVHRDRTGASVETRRRADLVKPVAASANPPSGRCATAACWQAGLFRRAERLRLKCSLSSVSEVW